MELGEGGLRHFQAVVGYSKEVRFERMKKDFPGCNLEKPRNALASWRYCGKEDTKIEGPLDHGVPPACRNIKGDTKARNAMIIEYGVVKAVDDGLLRIEQFKQVKQGIDLYKVMKQEFKSLDKLDNEWHWGETGTGKSRGVREKYPDAYIKGNNIWWCGYDGQDVVVIEELGPKMIGA